MKKMLGIIILLLVILTSVRAGEVSTAQAPVVKNPAPVVNNSAPVVSPTLQPSPTNQNTVPVVSPATQTSPMLQNTAPVVNAVAPVVSTTAQASPTLQASPEIDVVRKVLDSLLGVMSSKKETQFQKMETFNGCFLNPKAKQKVFMSLVLPQMSKYQIVKETTTDTGKNIEVNVTLQQGTKKYIFSLIYRKKAWWIAGMD